MQERILISNDRELQNAVLKAVAVLRCGGIVLYPTDTLYGLGVDALNVTALKKLFELKERELTNPVTIMVSGMKMARTYVEMNRVTNILVEKFFPGPLTLVLPKKEGTPSLLTGERTTLGIRIPDNIICKKLSEMFENPITATSANKSGLLCGDNVDDILTQLGTVPDLVLDVGHLSSKEPSTIVEVTSNAVKIIRAGAIPESEILKCVP